MKQLILIALLVIPFCKSADSEGIGIDIAAIEREDDTLDLSGLGITDIYQIEVNRHPDDQVKFLNLSNNEISSNVRILILAKVFPNLKEVYIKGNPIDELYLGKGGLGFDKYDQGMYVSWNFLVLNSIQENSRPRVSGFGEYVKGD